MGYERSTLKLKFKDEEFEGLVVRMRRLPLGDLFAVTALADLGEAIAERQEALDSLLTMVEANLLSWNLQEDGADVPMVKGTPARFGEEGSQRVYVASTGLYSLDIDFILVLVGAWMNAAAGVAPPLPQRSSDTGPSEELFRLMEPSPESPVSLATQN